MCSGNVISAGIFLSRPQKKAGGGDLISRGSSALLHCAEINKGGSVEFWNTGGRRAQILGTSGVYVMNIEQASRQGRQ